MVQQLSRSWDLKFSTYKGGGVNERGIGTLNWEPLASWKPYSSNIK